MEKRAAHYGLPNEDIYQPSVLGRMAPKTTSSPQTEDAESDMSHVDAYREAMESVFESETPTLASASTVADTQMIDDLRSKVASLEEENAALRAEAAAPTPTPTPATPETTSATPMFSPEAEAQIAELRAVIEEQREQIKGLTRSIEHLVDGMDSIFSDIYDRIEKVSTPAEPADTPTPTPAPTPDAAPAAPAPEVEMTPFLNTVRFTFNEDISGWLGKKANGLLDKLKAKNKELKETITEEGKQVTEDYKKMKDAIKAHKEAKKAATNTEPTPDSDTTTTFSAHPVSKKKGIFSRMKKAFVAFFAAGTVASTMPGCSDSEQPVTASTPSPTTTAAPATPTVHVPIYDRALNYLFGTRPLGYPSNDSEETADGITVRRDIFTQSPLPMSTAQPTATPTHPLLLDPANTTIAITTPSPTPSSSLRVTSPKPTASPSLSPSTTPTPSATPSVSASPTPSTAPTPSVTPTASVLGSHTHMVTSGQVAIEELMKSPIAGQKLVIASLLQIEPTTLDTFLGFDGGTGDVEKIRHAAEISNNLYGTKFKAEHIKKIMSSYTTLADFENAYFHGAMVSKEGYGVSQTWLAHLHSLFVDTKIMTKAEAQAIFECVAQDNFTPMYTRTANGSVQFTHQWKNGVLYLPNIYMTDTVHKGTKLELNPASNRIYVALTGNQQKEFLAYVQQLQPHYTNPVIVPASTTPVAPTAPASKPATSPKSTTPPASATPTAAATPTPAPTSSTPAGRQAPGQTAPGVPAGPSITPSASPTAEPTATPANITPAGRDASVAYKGLNISDLELPEMELPASAKFPTMKKETPSVHMDVNINLQSPEFHSILKDGALGSGTNDYVAVDTFIKEKTLNYSVDLDGPSITSEKPSVN